MARIRTIKPEFWRSPDTAKATPRARLLYIAMWNWADDYGLAEWTPRELLAFAFPNDEDVTTAEFQRLCKEVADCYGTQFYMVRGRRYYCVQTWDDHQKTERRASERNPRPNVEDAQPDQGIYGAEEMRGNSAVVLGSSASGKGTGEQGNRGKGTGETALVAPGPDIVALFDEAYDHWPKKIERKDAFNRWKTACRKVDPIRLTRTVVAFGDAYAATTERQFVPALGGWLNQERWTDELPQPPESRRKPNKDDELVGILALGREMEQNARKAVGQ